MNWLLAKRYVATKNVTINESFFRGHFPGNPVMPGVLIIETLAQAASILILKSPEFFKKTAYLGAIHNGKFDKWSALETFLSYTSRWLRNADRWELSMR